MRGVFQYKDSGTDFYEYYFITLREQNRPFSEWGIIRITQFDPPRVLREPAEAFHGEAVLLIMFGLKYLLSPLAKGRTVQKVTFDN